MCAPYSPRRRPGPRGPFARWLRYFGLGCYRLGAGTRKSGRSDLGCGRFSWQGCIESRSARDRRGSRCNRRRSAGVRARSRLRRRLGGVGRSGPYAQGRLARDASRLCSGGTYGGKLGCRFGGLGSLRSGLGRRRGGFRYLRSGLRCRGGLLRLCACAFGGRTGGGLARLWALGNLAAQHPGTDQAVRGWLGRDSRLLRLAHCRRCPRLGSTTGRGRTDCSFRRRLRRAGRGGPGRCRLNGALSSSGGCGTCADSALCRELGLAGGHCCSAVGIARRLGRFCCRRPGPGGNTVSDRLSLAFGRCRTGDRGMGGEQGTYPAPPRCRGLPVSGMLDQAVAALALAPGRGGRCRLVPGLRDTGPGPRDGRGHRCPPRIGLMVALGRLAETKLPDCAVLTAKTP